MPLFGDYFLIKANLRLRGKAAAFWHHRVALDSRPGRISTIHHLRDGAEHKLYHLLIPYYSNQGVHILLACLLLTNVKNALCVYSRASSPCERIGDPAKGALGHGDLERPSGRHRHWLRHLPAGTAQYPLHRLWIFN